MKISIPATVETEDVSPTSTVLLGSVERAATADPACEMGLWIGDAHALMEKLQSIGLDGKPVNSWRPLPVAFWQGSAELQDQAVGEGCPSRRLEQSRRLTSWWVSA
jgi:hypothetical protein